MCINHRFNRILAGTLICTIFGMIVYEAIEGKEPNYHLPHNDYNLSANNIQYPTTVSGTTSTVAGSINLTRMG